MSSIWITDNHKPIQLDAVPNERYCHNITDKEQTISDINEIANKELNSISLKDNPNLLIFPRDLYQYGDNIGESHIISLKDDKISTGNIMGFVGLNQTQIDIKSRFANFDNEDYFLHYMLQKVFSINLFDIKHTTNQEQIFDFLLYLFPHFLKKALAQGLFKKYKRHEYNDANVRGPIDVNRHIRQNIPFKGTVAYTIREHSYDNEVTQLVRHTIEYIRTKEQGSAILNNDLETKTCVSQIIMATQTYNLRDRNKIINQNLRPVRHPYYSDYTELQKICLQILRHESLKYGQEKDKIYGILFDGAWLWEEYLNTIFEKNNLEITHAKNKTKETGIQIYKGSCNYYPDFYKREKGDEMGEKSFVFDAKYKRLGYDVKTDGQDDLSLNKISICHDDLFQMITYMHTLPAKHCALLYPIEPNELNEQDKNNSAKVIVSKKRELYGFGGEIFGYGIKVSSQNDKNLFWEEMQCLEEDFCKKINKFREEI
ncbi:MAG: hypothetical protein IKO90_01145 [Bacteroidales bacterium]|nr:hypothetical protein [Bacteroidales bacterium]